MAAFDRLWRSRPQPTGTSGEVLEAAAAVALAPPPEMGPAATSPTSPLAKALEMSQGQRSVAAGAGPSPKTVAAGVGPSPKTAAAGAGPSPKTVAASASLPARPPNGTAVDLPSALAAMVDRSRCGGAMAPPLQRPGRVLVYGAQGSGASVLAFLLAQAPNTAAVLSLLPGRQAPTPADLKVTAAAGAAQPPGVVLQVSLRSRPRAPKDRVLYASFHSLFFIFLIVSGCFLSVHELWFADCRLRLPSYPDHLKKKPQEARVVS
jgi:hypothetical protein